MLKQDVRSKTNVHVHTPQSYPAASCTCCLHNQCSFILSLLPHDLFMHARSSHTQPCLQHFTFNSMYILCNYGYVMEDKPNQVQQGASEVSPPPPGCIVHVGCISK